MPSPGLTQTTRRRLPEADAVYEAVEALNVALRNAAEVGLHAHIDVDYIDALGRTRQWFASVGIYQEVGRGY